MSDTFSASDWKIHLILSNLDIPGISAEGNNGFTVIVNSFRLDDPRCPIDGGSISRQQSFRDKCCEREVLNLQCFCRLITKDAIGKGSSDI